MSNYVLTIPTIDICENMNAYGIIWNSAYLDKVSELFYTGMVE
ncbi:hypothetical protein C240_229 [Enterococcus sp. 5H]|nr:hypothetical protein [Enterococcus sp. 5H]